MHGSHAVRNGAAEYGEGAFGRDEAFQCQAVFLSTAQGAVVILGIMYACIGFDIFHGLESFQIHGMEYETAVIVEGKSWSVRVPAVACVPFFHFSNGRVDAVGIIGRSGLGQETFDGRGEQQPVGIGRIDAAQQGEFFDITLLGGSVERLPQLVEGSEEAFGNIGSVYQWLTFLAPQQVVGALRVDGVGIALQGPFAQLLAHGSFFRLVIGQGEPRCNACHQASEGFHVGHFLVASVPRGAYFYNHVFLQFPFSHVAQDGSCHLVG